MEVGKPAADGCFSADAAPRPVREISSRYHCEKIFNVPLYRMTPKIKPSLTQGNIFLYDSCRVQCILFTVKSVLVYLISMSVDNNKE